VPQSEEGRSEEETRYNEVAFTKDLCRSIRHSSIFDDGVLIDNVCDERGTGFMERFNAIK
jgi:hypothetical protein